MKLSILATATLVAPINFVPTAMASEPIEPVLERSPIAESHLVSQSELSDAMQTISNFRQQINAAATQYKVDPDLVGAILLDELERKDRHYFDPSSTRDSHWVYIGDDTLTTVLAHTHSKLALKQDWSIGIAQMTPQTAQHVSGKAKQTAVKVLLDEEKSIELVAAWIAQTIEDWRGKYPQIEQRPDIIATLYSQGYQPSNIRGCPTSDVRGCPKSNERGKEIAGDMARIHVILIEPFWQNFAAN